MSASIPVFDPESYRPANAPPVDDVASPGTMRARLRRRRHDPAVPPVPLDREGGGDDERHYISGNLRRLLSARRLHNEAAAAVVGVDYRTLSAIKAGRQCPTLATVRQIAERLGCSVIDLTGEPLDMASEDVANVSLIEDCELADCAGMVCDCVGLQSAANDYIGRWTLGDIDPELFHVGYTEGGEAC